MFQSVFFENFKMLIAKGKTSETKAQKWDQTKISYVLSMQC